MNFFTSKGSINAQSMHMGIKDATASENMSIDVLTCFPRVV